MGTPPANVGAARVAVVPGALVPGRVWLVYERLDGGEVAHVRYVGLLPAQDGETAEALMERAAAKVAEERG